MKHLIRYWKLGVAVVFLAVVIFSYARIATMQAKEVPTPAEVAAAEAWLDANTPEIKATQAKLDALREDQAKRVKVLEAFGYDYDWDNLTLVKQVFPTR